MFKRITIPYQLCALLTLLLISFFDLAYAQGTLVAGTSDGCGADSLFSPPCTDKSIEYLSRIFGAVGGVLTGVEGTLLQQMFSIFNAAVLGLGSIVIMYTLFVGTMKTAHEGEMLGQKWSSIWIPLKSVIGIIMIVPAKASGGYSFIQVFFMWVIIQGVGAADSLWTTILESLDEQRPVIAQPMMMGSKMQFKDTFKGLVCMYALNKLEDPSGVPSYAPVAEGNRIYFRAGPHYGDKCGYVSVAEGGNVTGDAPLLALQDSLSVLQDAAMSVVYDERSTDWPTGALTAAIGNYAGAMFGAVRNYKQNDGSASTMNAAMARARDNGWIFAGSYYYDIARIQDRISVQVFNVPKVNLTYRAQLASDRDFALPNATNDLNRFNEFMKKADEYIAANPIQGSASSYAQQDTAGSFSAESSGGAGGSGSLIDASDSEQLASGDSDSPISGVTDLVFDGMNDLLGFFQQHMSGEDPVTGQQINPMFAMQTFGTYMLAVVELIWIGTTVLLVVFGLVALATGWIPLAGDSVMAGLMGLLTIITWIISWLSPILLIMFTTGAVLAHYVPLIPFLFFTFGAIGWLMLCFEAMVAAPVVALGILHPEEHDIWGKASPALHQLVNVFLTPSLMLFGLIGAMMLSYVVVSMVNFGFYNTMVAFSGINEDSMVGQIAVAITSITTFVAFIVVYMATIMWSVEKCFTLITELRVRVLAWIGIQAQSFGESEGLQKVGAAHKQGAEAGAQMGQAPNKHVGEASKKMTKNAYGRLKGGGQVS